MLQGRVFCSIKNAESVFASRRVRKHAAGLLEMAGERLTMLVGLIWLILSALAMNDCGAVTSVSVTPGTYTLGDAATVVTLEADTAAAGNRLTFDVYIDVEGDGVLDPEDTRFMSFRIADGEAPHLGNEGYWHDEDGAADSAVSATLVANGAWWFSGDFIVKVTDEDASTATTSFAVVQDSTYPCIVTGQVQFEGSAAAGAIVQVMDATLEKEISMAVAGADGTFEMRVESPGQYGVYAMEPGRVSKLEGGSGQMVDVSSGSNALPVPLVLFAGNRAISGRLFDSGTRDGLPGIPVTASGEGLFALAIADDDGNYNLVVVEGQWDEVSAEESEVSRLGYVPPEIRSVTVSGGNVPGEDFPCVRATTLITGTVKDAETQEALRGYVVYAEARDGDGGTEITAYTGSDGSYKIGVIEGDWWVGLEKDRLIGTGYAPPPSQLASAPASGTVPDVDFLLEKAGTITGHVYEDDGQTPIEGASVEVHDFVTGNWVARTETLPDGSYTVRVPSGTYRVSVFGVEGFLDQHYLGVFDWTDATPVAVSAPDETSGIDFVLVRAAYISGHVYEDNGVTPIEGASVDASVFGPAWEWATSDQTGADGSYRLSVPTGTYKILVHDVPGWLDQFYDGVRFDDEATPVNGVEGQETSGIDFVLEAAAYISGHVYEADGRTPISGAMAAALDEAIGKWTGTTTGDDGSYSIPVPGGSYKVWAAADGWVGEYYDDTYRVENATVITVAAPEERSGINFALTEATARIKGHVYREDGSTPVVGARIVAYDYTTGDYMGWTETGDDGSYTLPVPPGSFRVSAWSHRWQLQYYDHQSSYEGAAPVTLSNSEVLENIDFDLTWIPFVVENVHESAQWPGGLEVRWSWTPGMCYSVYWTEELSDGQTVWHEVPDAYKDIVQEGENGGLMTWIDKGSAPGMDGNRPGDPGVRRRFYKVEEEPE